MTPLNAYFQQRPKSNKSDLDLFYIVILKLTNPAIVASINDFNDITILQGEQMAHLAME